MLKQRFLLNQPNNVSVVLLEEMFKSLVKIDEATWGFYEFSKEILRYKVSTKEKKEIASKSIQCGVYWASLMKAKFGLGVDLNKKATELTNLLGLSINERMGKPTKFRMVFAQFVGNQTIEIIKEPIERYTELVLTSKILPCPEVVREVLIAHEIFHYLEAQYHDQEEMYPHQKTIKLWRLFNYEHRSTIGAASEIAAMAFAKELCSADFVPQILDILLSYPMEIQFSRSVYEAIMDAACSD